MASLRYQRINDRLRSERGIPIYDGPLWEIYVTIRPRCVAEIRGRALALWVVSLYAEGVPLDEIWSDFVNKDDVWRWISPLEQEFLSNSKPDADEAQSLVWRIESAWVLLWALGFIDELHWPVSCCDTKHFVRVMMLAARDPLSFERNSKLRSVDQIGDAHSVTMRLHWAIVDAHQNQRQIPANLDWLNPNQFIDAAPTLAGRLLEERHRALNWLLRQFGEDWDEIEIHT